MEEIDGIHKSRLRGKWPGAEDEPEEKPERPGRGKRRLLLTLVTMVLLVGIVAGGLLLIRDVRATGNVAKAPAEQKWCTVQGNSAVDGFHDIAALSANDIWIVGDASAGISEEFEHWDGTHWSVFDGPTVSPAFTGRLLNENVSLEAMRAFASDDIWTIGSIHILDSASLPLGRQNDLIEHWNGSQWQVVKSPNLYNTATAWNDLNIIAGSSATDVWVAGYASPAAPVGNVGFASTTTLLEHWDGRAWSLVSLPATLSKNFQPTSMAVLAPGDIWLAGFVSGQNEETSSHLWHWDGKSWYEVPLSRQFGRGVLVNAVAGSSSNNVWAFGSDGDVPLIIHWDGSVWSSVPVAPVGQQGSALQGPVAIDGVNNIWVAGSVENGKVSGPPFLEHWSGQGWQPVSLPQQGTSGMTYVSGLATTAGKVWLLLDTYSQKSTVSSIQTRC